MASERSTTPRDCARAVLDTVPSGMQALRTLMRSRRGADLSVPQFRALAYIGRRHGCSLSDVAQHVGTALPSMSKLVDGLVGRGLVERAAETDDRRRVALSLTQRGDALLTLAVKGAETALADLFSGVPAGERAAVVATLHRLASLFDAARVPKESS